MGMCYQISPSHWAPLSVFLFILLLKEDLKGNCALIPRSAPEAGEKEPYKLPMRSFLHKGTATKQSRSKNTKVIQV